jgi:hypothetical protein
MTEEVKAPKKEKAPKPEKVVQNGVVRPNAGTKTAKVWDIADALSAKLQAPAARKDVLAEATKADINVSTAATQYGQWRKFHNLGKEPTEKTAAAE